MSDSRDAGDYFEMALNQEEQGLMDEAIVSYTEAIRLYPQFADAFYQRGMLFLLRGDYALAVNDFDQALAINPYNVSACYERGVAYYFAGEYERALRDFEDVLGANPNHDLANEGRERSLRKLGRKG
ncbi:MAG: tetratricopeptide repeat protein [Anaerolineae bacterium]|nr:tetratricopeptide repeat protein [Anaerolineae bacterium]